jgi:hypothetical protein
MFRLGLLQDGDAAVACFTTWILVAGQRQSRCGRAPCDAFKALKARVPG